MGTVKNLKKAIAGESPDKRMYLAFAQKAESEGYPWIAKMVRAAATSFQNALAVEKIHHDLYSEALESLKRRKNLSCQDIFICDTCVNTVYGHAPDKCPVCGAPKRKFTKVP